MKPTKLLTVDEAILWRRDVRHFKEAPIAASLLLDIMTMADRAPSVGNSQPWRMVLVETVECRNAIRRSHEDANADAALDYPDQKRDEYLKLKLAGFDAAPVHLAVFCDQGTTQGHRLGRKTMPEMLRYSCVAMISTMWLIARARGVGMGWVSILEPGKVSRAVGVPDDWFLVGYLLLGWPETEQLEPELERMDWQRRTPVEARIRRI